MGSLELLSQGDQSFHMHGNMHGIKPLHEVRLTMLLSTGTLYSGPLRQN